MFSRMALTVCLMGSCVWCLALATRADSAPSEGTDDGFKPVASVESLMHGQVTFFKAIGKELEEAPSEHRNHEIEEAAEVLAELANVNRYNNTKEDYRAWATQLRDTAMKLANEAEKKKDADDARMNKLYLQMKKTCGDCHDAYQ